MSLIIAEGKHDIAFIKSYIEYIGIIDLNNINIIDAGGRDNIKKCETDIKRAIECDEKVLIIFDADNDFQDSRNNIFKQLEELNLTSLNEENIFLFPNNKDEGNFETLFCKISKYTDIFDCFDKYINCIENINIYNIKLPKNKDKIYAYLDCFGLRLTDNYFHTLDLQSDYLLPLKTFLESNINDEE